ncbi:hypothetical protein TCELL_0287 [Thermogladius calderae 1633]|uniref:HMA domain-containing protein n=1 Tax=Thermogladius calderae (strain DSM 22663 / VKM B-2946 / 1633) TaxID=1184251 RepID=I3TD74_THEC1|nr:hypothetical protein [Thermogladius calderae]AFK50712.1 hypothetical protein TCELL_0287 [Thermogladius calderae 1633]
MKRLVMRIKSVGCPGCIATALIHLFKIRGVKGARVVGMNIIVLLDDDVDPKVVVEDPVINEYYRVQTWSVEEYKSEALAGQYSLTPR